MLWERRCALLIMSDGSLLWTLYSNATKPGYGCGKLKPSYCDQLSSFQ